MQFENIYAWISNVDGKYKWDMERSVFELVEVTGILRLDKTSVIASGSEWQWVAVSSIVKAASK